MLLQQDQTPTGGQEDQKISRYWLAELQGAQEYEAGVGDIVAGEGYMAQILQGPQPPFQFTIQLHHPHQNQQEQYEEAGHHEKHGQVAPQLTHQGVGEGQVHRQIQEEKEKSIDQEDLVIVAIEVLLFVGCVG